MPLPEIDEQQQEQRGGEHERGDGSGGGQVKLLQAFEEARTHVDEATTQFFSSLTTEEHLQLIDMLRRLSCGEENIDPKGDK